MAIPTGELAFDGVRPVAIYRGTTDPAGSIWTAVRIASDYASIAVKNCDAVGGDPIRVAFLIADTVNGVFQAADLLRFEDIDPREGRVYQLARLEITPTTGALYVYVGSTVAAAIPFVVVGEP